MKYLAKSENILKTQTLCVFFFVLRKKGIYYNIKAKRIIKTLYKCFKNLLTK